jgi:hypothetical protein
MMAEALDHDHARRIAFYYNDPAQRRPAVNDHRTVVTGVFVSHDDVPADRAASNQDVG